MNFFKKYLWAFEFFGAVIIVTFGIYTITDPKIVLFIIGAALIIFNLFRIIPLVKTTHDKPMKYVFIGEFILNMGVAVYVILKGNEATQATMGNMFGYLIGGVLYLRGVIHFYATTLRKEPSDHIGFFANVGFLTLGLVIILGTITFDHLAMILLVIAILSALFISYNGFRNYKNFRYEQKAKEDTKRIKIKEEIKDEIRKEDPRPTKEDRDLPEKEERDEVTL